MEYIIFFALCFMTGMLGRWAHKAKMSEKPLRVQIVNLLLCGMFTAFMQCLFVITTNVTIAKLELALYYTGIDLIVIMLLHYAEAYTETFHGQRMFQGFLYALLGLDALNMVLNVFWEHVFTLQRTELWRGLEGWSVEQDTVSFRLHLVGTYILIVFVLLSFLIKTIKTPWLYKNRYHTILMLLLAAIVLNGLCTLMKSPFDVSVFLYGFIGILICHYSLFYTPKALIDQTLAMVAEDMSDAIYCFDLWGKCVFSNRKAKEYFPEYENVGQQEEMFRKWMENHEESNGNEVVFDKRMEVAEGSKYYRVTYRKLLDDKNNYIGCFFSMSDRTAEIEHFKEEHYRITHDALTGVYNREYFFEMAEKMLREHPKEQYCMVCSNIKGFKLFNELFGQELGNEVLKLEADLLKRDAGEGNVYGRISGDEFAMLIPANRFIAEKFLVNVSQIKEQFTSSQYQMHISIGVYMVNDSTEPVGVMCDKAKLAIESNRGDYDSIITYYDEKLLDRSLYERKIIGEFDRAIEQKEFCMFLQPQMDANGRLLGAEALVRWRHPERGLVFPGDFIEVFEKTGLIYRLDRLMWEFAAEKLREWKALGREDLHISVNISARDFYHLDLYREFTGLVEKYGIEPKNLKLEITETVLMTEMRSRLELLDRLRFYGFQIEIDDFGSGYSSLNMLKDIEVDIVKIDMGFLRKSEQQEKGRSILNSIIHLVKAIGMDVITEGVETKEQADNLTEMGCEIFQGYYFSKPISVADFETKYAIGR